MTATILPADGMIDVLSDAIASKRDTIALLERTAKDAQADLQHLREVRAVRLARAAGFEVGQVWVTTVRHHGALPAVIFDIQPAWQESGSDDWLITLVFERESNYSSNTEKLFGKNASAYCVGRVESGSILEKFATLARVVREQKDKAA